MPQVQIVVIGSLLDALPGLERAAAEVRHEIADAVHDAAFTNAAEDTGALKASLYITDERGSTYGPAVGAASGKNKGFAALPEVPAELDTTIVAVAAEYGAEAEYYTGPVNPNNHPYFTPAVEGQRQRFAQAVADIGGRTS